ncbi:transcriptional regulator, MerR family [Ruminococcaceae bacterium KH2T8]|nr:transcriptional regulator, MerR family [Ruminococcaceae bacterium KH2T8]
MMTVHEVSKIAGVSIRTLQYYDKIGLLHPAGYSDSGYRLYDDTDLKRLQQIMLFRELEFPLKDIGKIVEDPNFDQGKALRQQIELLELKKEHLEDLIELARNLQKKGENYMDFKAFDTSKIEEFAREAKKSWGDTPEYKEYEKKNGKKTVEETKAMADKMMEIIAEFGPMKDTDPSSDEAQAQVVKLQSYISDNYYKCSDEILAGLGQMYVAGGEFTDNIDAAGGKGTAEFISKAIEIHCGK